MMKKLSIITVTYNAEETLERTIKSVEQQSCDSIEYIIIDGGSTDNTLGIAENHRGSIDILVSEPDNGIYDAMNKGLSIASGEYVWFLNSGDEIASNETVDMLLSEAMNTADVIYGDTIMTSLDGSIIGGRRLSPPEKLTWKSFRNGMVVCHQSFIARRLLCSDYDTSYRFSADYEWCLKILKKSHEIYHTHSVISRFLDGGITKQNIIPGLRERFKIMSNHFGFFMTCLYHIPISIRFFCYLIKNWRF
ncbi:MAG: glycosyltransferase [Marinilabiliaceae bacterium]|nr:glycosyltransferase [Marinilabiliaceae bacterium]